MGRGIEQLTVLKVGLGEIQPNVFHLNFRIGTVKKSAMYTTTPSLKINININEEVSCYLLSPVYIFSSVHFDAGRRCLIKICYHSSF